MKTFAKLLFVLFVITAFLGLAAGLFAQMELFRIGVDFDAGISFWGRAVKLHAIFLLLAVPILLFCINMYFLIAPHVRPKLVRFMFAVCALLFLVLLVCVFQGFTKPSFGNTMFGNMVFVTVLLLCLLAQTIFMFAHIKSPSAIFYAVSALVPFLGMAPIAALVNIDPGFTSQTYLVTSLFHVEGIVLACLCFASAALWIDRTGRHLKFSASIFHAVLMVVIGMAMVFAQMRLGLQGTPRGYYDYPQDFAALQYMNSLAGFAFVFIIVIGIARMIVAGKNAPKVADVF